MRFQWRWLLLMALIAAGLARLRFDADVLDLLPANVRAVAGLKIYQQHFTNSRELIITLQAADADEAKAAAQAVSEALRAQTNLVAEVTWQPPWLEHPEQSVELIAYLWLNQPPEVFSELSARLAETNLSGVLAATREQLATTLSPEDIARSGYDPFGFSRLPQSLTGLASGFGGGDRIFSSADGAFRIIFVKARDELAGYRECTDWLEAVKRSVADTPQTRGIKTGFTGRPAFVAEISAGMKKDITFSVGGTSLIIAILFWIAHRRLKPMLWLLVLLALILLTTLALGGLIFGTVSVLSMGFAAILLGLAVDYGVVHYQEAVAQPELTIPQIRRAIAPAIFWAAVTTICAFLVLNFGGLPGLAQLGSLVGLGVAVSACVMIFAFLPPLFPERMQFRESPPREPTGSPPIPASNPVNSKMAVLSVAVLTILCSVILASGFPKVDATADALQPRNSQAYAALESIKENLGQKREPLWVVISDSDEEEVAARLQAMQPVLENAVSNQTLSGFTSPLPFWPRPSFQRGNAVAARKLISERTAFHDAAKAGGFEETSLALADEVLSTWKRADSQSTVFWPTNPLSSWILEKLAARGTNQFYATAFLYPAEGVKSFAPLESGLARQGVWLSSWELLGGAVLAEVQRNMWKLLVPMIGLVLLSLWLALRSLNSLLLSIGMLFISAAILLASMKMLGWSWNLFNLMALPLMLGTGVDYGIFMQLALRRHKGDLQFAHRSVGRALLLCGGTAIAGFGSLGFSSNAGMAGLGRICAIGIGANMLLAVYLLPNLWKLSAGKSAMNLSGDGGRNIPGSATVSVAVSGVPPDTFPSGGEKAPNLTASRCTQPASLNLPSSFYSYWFWRLGILMARILPFSTSKWIAKNGAAAYWRLAPHRKKIVMENLLPVFDGNAAAAAVASRDLFTEFALKLVDLWRYEGGRNSAGWFLGWKGWETFAAAKARGRGVLFVSPHLGNWELGGAFMSDKNHSLLVLTQEEPDPRLTAMRKAIRAGYGVETLVVGNDMFAFVEIIKRLNSNATVALLVDRPAAQTSVVVDLFGRKFRASIAAAEIARASGCAILPTIIVRRNDGYLAEILPEVTYDRATIGSRDERVRLTQEILRAFEPSFRQYASQWYHFVPIWEQEKS